MATQRIQRERCDIDDVLTERERLLIADALRAAHTNKLIVNAEAAARRLSGKPLARHFEERDASLVEIARLIARFERG